MMVYEVEEMYKGGVWGHPPQTGGIGGPPPIALDARPSDLLEGPKRRGKIGIEVQGSNGHRHC